MTTNGKSRTTAVLVIVIQALVCLAITYWIGRIEGIEAEADEHVKWSNEKVIQYEQRITTTEERNAEILRRLERIESKLDRLDFPKAR